MHAHFSSVLNAALLRQGITNFTASEFAPERREPPPEHRWLMILPTAKLLQGLRDAGCGVVTINSGYRPHWYNEALGGARKSQHPLFTATDITTQLWTPDEVADWLETSTFAPMIGLGRYRTFTHLDTRHWAGNPQNGEPAARWDKR